MATEIIVAIAVGGWLVGVISWFVANKLAARRERENDRRDYRAKFLIDAWVTLADTANRDDSSRLPTLEGAIAKIQLLGTAHQIELAQAFSVQMAQESSGSLDELLADLRQNLREELGFEPVSNAMVHFRVKSK